jgi:small-conductance mechanosensitive channel
MDALWLFLQENWRSVLLPLGWFLAALAAGLVGRWLAIKAGRRWALKNQASALFFKVLARSLLLWSLLLGAYLALNAAPLAEPSVDKADQALLILWVLSLTWDGSRLAANLVSYYGSKIPGALPVTSLTQNLARGLVILVGVLVLLNLFGISIVPILTALGVGGLAVALALKDTLSNLFAGFHVSVAGVIRPGDYIKLDSGQEGYVADIGWRCTTLRMLGNNLIILPNEKLAQAIVTNYSLPESTMSLSIPVSVGYGVDPDLVEHLLVDVARQGAADIPGLLAEPAPSASLIPGFGESALQFSLGCSVAQFTDQYSVQHELRKRILKRFRDAQIQMPYPARTVYVHSA